MAINWTHLGGEFGPVLKEALDDAGARLNAFRYQTKLPALRDLLVQMRDGDNSNVSHYAEIATRFAAADTTAAKAFMDQVESYYGIMTNSASTLAQVYAAHDQMQAILKNV